MLCESKLKLKQWSYWKTVRLWLWYRSVRYIRIPNWLLVDGWCVLVVWLWDAKHRLPVQVLYRNYFSENKKGESNESIAQKIHPENSAILYCAWMMRELYPVSLLLFWTILIALIVKSRSDGEDSRYGADVVSVVVLPVLHHPSHRQLLMRFIQYNTVDVIVKHSLTRCMVNKWLQIMTGCLGVSTLRYKCLKNTRTCLCNPWETNKHSMTTSVS